MEKPLSHQQRGRPPMLHTRAARAIRGSIAPLGLDAAPNAQNNTRLARWRPSLLRPRRSVEFQHPSADISRWTASPPTLSKKLKESIEICDVVHTWKESSPKDPPTSGANYISTGFGSVSATFWIERGGSAADVMGLPAWRCVAFEPGPSATAKGASPFVWVWGRFGMDLTALHALRVQPF